MCNSGDNGQITHILFAYLGFLMPVEIPDQACVQCFVNEQFSKGRSKNVTEGVNFKL